MTPAVAAIVPLMLGWLRTLLGRRPSPVEGPSTAPPVTKTRPVPPGDAASATPQQTRRDEPAEGAAAAADPLRFLGRGVSYGLCDHRGDEAKLRRAGLPGLAHPREIATLLDISPERLRWLAFHHDAAAVSHYVQFTVPKRAGGVRTLAAPKAELKAAQRQLLETLVSRLPAHKAAHGFVPGRSPATGAVHHTGRDLVVCLDLVDFFGSLTFPRVRGWLQHVGYSPAVATTLALLTTESPRRVFAVQGERRFVAAGPRSLPQGACTSPGLANALAAPLDGRLHPFAASLGWRYTRYADDLTFSAAGSACASLGGLLRGVRRILSEEGFAENAAKTRIQRRSGRQVVTGLVVNEGLSVPRPLRRRLRAILHAAAREGIEAQNREGHPDFAGWLRGQIAQVEYVDPEQGRPLREAYERLTRDEAPSVSQPGGVGTGGVEPGGINE